MAELEQDPEGWSPAEKAAAVQLYGPERNWRALEREYGRSFVKAHGLVSLVKRWTEETEAGHLEAEPEADPAAPEDQEQEAEIAQRAEELRPLYRMKDWTSLADRVADLAAGVEAQLLRSRSTREKADSAATLDRLYSIVERLQRRHTAEEGQLGGDVNVQIETIAQDMIPPPEHYSSDTLRTELEGRGFVVSRPLDGAPAPPPAPPKVPGPPDLAVAGNGPEKPSTSPPAPVPDPPKIEKVDRRGDPAGRSGGRRGPRVRMGGRSGVRDASLEGLGQGLRGPRPPEGLSDADRARWEAFHAGDDGAA